MPSRRHCRQTGPIYLAKFSSPYLSDFYSGAVYGHWQAFVPLTTLQTRLEHRSDRGPRDLASETLNSALLRRTAAVVRNRRHILDGPHFDTRRGQRANRRFAAGARTADPHFHRPQPAFRALLAAVMAACWAANGVPLRDPRKPSEPALDQEMRVAFLIRDGHDRVVEGGLDMHDARMDDALFLLLEALLLACF